MTADPKRIKHFNSQRQVCVERSEIASFETNSFIPIFGMPKLSEMWSPANINLIKAANRMKWKKKSLWSDTASCEEIKTDLFI